MITAEEARKLNDEYAAKQLLDLEGISTQIRIAATKGWTLVRANLSKIDYSYRNRIFENIKAHFEEKGFNVKRETYSDMRDGDSYDNAVISW